MMENLTVSELRSRSRSKTPFLRSSCDREHCTEGEEHTHKSGRKTPVSRNTPVKQLYTNSMTEITEQTKDEILAPAHRTRQSTRAAAEKVKTSDYSSEESLDRLTSHGKEVYQNEINSQYERVSTSSHHYGALADLTLSPIQSMHHVTLDRSSRIGSPTYSACSTDSSFAEQALADTSALLDREPTYDHLPYRLYKMAGEYWNKYPKTDYTYSHMSKDRVELAPGQVAVPNMSRRSLSMFRLQGPTTNADEIDKITTWSSSETRKRYTVTDTSDDEGTYYQGNGGHHLGDQRWWITQVVVGFISAITTAASNSYRRIFGPKHRYPYTDRRPEKGNTLTTPFVWMYTLITKVVTSTVTTITETFTQGNESEREKYISRTQQQQTRKRSWWPWILLLLLPLVGYGCYHYKDYVAPQETPVIDNYKPPVIITDPDLTKRMAALEQWAVDVDTKFKYFDQKLSKLDNLDARIEQYSIKHLQNNLVQIFSEADVGPIAAKLKEYFDQHYLTKDQKQVISQEIHERLIASWNPSIDEDRIRRIVQEYLSVFERQQMEVLVLKIQEYVKEVEVRHVDGGFDVEAVKRIVAGLLEIYDADKTGVVDYALESAGGQVISTKCTELYQIKTKQYSILGLPVWWVYTSPRYALSPGAMPAECWAFQGFPGYLVIRTYAIIEVTGFSLEHMSRLLAVEGKIESAPKNFSVYGLHGEMDPDPHLFGNYMYDANGTSIQHFPVIHRKTVQIGDAEYPVAYDMIELRVESNHGNPTYTCVYRFRVHGNPLTDIRQATEDSIRENET